MKTPERERLIRILHAALPRKDVRRYGKTYGYCAAIANGGTCGCSGACLRAMTGDELKSAVMYEVRVMKQEEIEAWIQEQAEALMKR